jgi:D-Tyr-tRNAtyr deacylase
MPPPPELAEPLYERFCDALRELGVPVETGGVQREDGGFARE